MNSARTTGKFILKGSGSNFIGTDCSNEHFEKLLGIYSTLNKAQAAKERAEAFYEGKSIYHTGACDHIWIEHPKDAYDVDVDLWEFDKTR